MNGDVHSSQHGVFSGMREGREGGTSYPHLILYWREEGGGGAGGKKFKTECDIGFCAC